MKRLVTFALLVLFACTCIVACGGDASAQNDQRTIWRHEAEAERAERGVYNVTRKDPTGHGLVVYADSAGKNGISGPFIMFAHSANDGPKVSTEYENVPFQGMKLFWENGSAALPEKASAHWFPLPEKVRAIGVPRIGHTKDGSRLIEVEVQYSYGWRTIAYCDGGYYSTYSQGMRSEDFIHP